LIERDAYAPFVVPHSPIGCKHLMRDLTGAASWTRAVQGLQDSKMTAALSRSQDAGLSLLSNASDASPAEKYVPYGAPDTSSARP
jgi:hypothetical protein